MICIKKISVLLIIILFLGAWYFYSNRNVVSVDHKYYASNEIDKALEELDFKAKIPQYISNGFSRSRLTIYNTDGESLLELRYTDDKQRSFYDFFASRLVKSIDWVVEEGEGFTWEEIQIHGNRGFKGQSDTSTEKRVFYKTDKNLYYEVTSLTLNFEEMIKILESI